MIAGAGDLESVGEAALQGCGCQAEAIEQQGLGYPQVIDHMQEMRLGTVKADHAVPDTLVQHDVLRSRAQRREA